MNKVFVRHGSQKIITWLGRLKTDSDSAFFILNLGHKLKFECWRCQAEAKVETELLSNYIITNSDSVIDITSMPHSLHSLFLN